VSYTNIFSTSETLRNLIETDLLADAGTNGLGSLFGGGGFTVKLATPEEMGADAQGVSVWLYRVLRDDTRLNDPPRLRPLPGGVVEVIPPPLPLRLHYLVTPLASAAPDTEQKILGRVMHLFHTRPTLAGSVLQADLAGTDAQLNVRLESLTLEELTRVWDALEGSYQLSVSYEVTLAYIECEVLPTIASPVESVVPGYASIIERSSA
jgi:uncharacterized protein DUF4255